jgi:hypothetical protein
MPALKVKFKPTLELKYGILMNEQDIATMLYYDISQLLTLTIYNLNVSDNCETSLEIPMGDKTEKQDTLTLTLIDNLSTQLKSIDSPYYKITNIKVLETSRVILKSESDNLINEIAMLIIKELTYFKPSEISIVIDTRTKQIYIQKNNTDYTEESKSGTKTKHHRINSKTLLSTGICSINDIIKSDLIEELIRLGINYKEGEIYND